MIIKPRPKPLRLLFIEAVLLRAPLGHPKIPIIEEDKGRVESGFRGELLLDSYTDQLPEKGFYIFRDLRLSNGIFFFQIDTLIITSTVIFTIETKNMTGELTFDQKGEQLIQINDNKQRVYDDPLLQVEFQSRQLRDWLKKHGFPAVPIEPLVMMSNSNAYLKLEIPPLARKRVCRGRRILFRIEEILNEHKVEKLEPGVIRKLNKLLLKSHTEPTFDIEKSYKIPKTNVRPGVHCKCCGHLGMVYRQGSWICPKCGAKSTTAHLSALRDYYLIHGKFINHRQIKEFLGFETPSITAKYLKKLNLPCTPAKKNRVYELPFDFLFNNPPE